MTLWSAILLAAVICLTLKAAGYLVPPRVLEAPRTARISDLLTVALLAALVAVQTLGDGQAITVDARVPALLVAGGLIYDTFASYTWLYVGSCGIGLGAVLIAMTFKPVPKARETRVAA